MSKSKLLMHVFILFFVAQSSDELWTLIVWFGFNFNLSEQMVTQPLMFVANLRSDGVMYE